jgi:hypothetical protein
VSPAVPSPDRHPDGLPPLFIDRSLGRITVPRLLRDAGLSVVTLADHYGIPADEQVADVTWLAETAARGWIAIGKDARIRRRPAEKAAIRRHDCRCFYFTRGDLSAPTYADRILGSLGAIIQACAEPGPFIYVVHPNRIERMTL